MVKVALVATLLAAALLGRFLRDDHSSSPVVPSTGSTVMTHPREGAMYHQPYTGTR